MALLIDGYNLLHVTGITGGGGKDSWRRSREALLNLLAAVLPERELPTATVVFDAASAPPGLPRRLNHRGITVLFAAEYDDADALLEELIQAESAPRSLVVVSSDHRVQRAARRRRATCCDSDLWYRQLWRQRVQVIASDQTGQSEKPAIPLSPEEIDLWVAKFSPGPSSTTQESTTTIDDHQSLPLANPFPEGYALDVFDEPDDNLSS
jgi:predicted RNA-binding protein with PIN domain